MSNDDKSFASLLWSEPLDDPNDVLGAAQASAMNEENTMSTRTSPGPRSPSWSS